MGERNQATTDPGDPGGRPETGSGRRRLAAGEEVGGYLIEAVAGAGGMGVVYRALDPELGRVVALKLIAPELAALPGFRARFTGEALAAAALEHPHVLPVYRAGEDGDRLYMAMRFVEGPTLGELIAERGRLSVGRAVRLVGQVAEALDAAHALGLVHRDVKPANVLIAGGPGEEHAYLADFGLTISDQGAARAAPGGRRGRAGTLAFLSPEQVRGDPLDARTDVYALGCLLYQALTGRPPFPGPRDEQVLMAHLAEPAPRPSELAPGLPAGLDAVVARALAKRPAERFPSAGALAQAAALAGRIDVMLAHHPADEPLARALAAAVRQQDLVVWPPPQAMESPRADERREAMEGCRVCAVLVGARGLEGWARDDVVVADERAAREQGFRLLLCLLPGAPDPFHPTLAFLAGRSVVDLRAGHEDAEAARELARVVGGAQTPVIPVELDGDSTPPYRGLERFDEEHASLFFGREVETARVLERLRAGRFAAVLGPSGSGKSSLVRAGVVPAVRAGALGSGFPRVIVVAPGANPLSTIAAALAAIAPEDSPSADDLAAHERILEASLADEHQGPTLLLVDQLEEIFTLCRDPVERDAFLRGLRFAATVPDGRIWVVVAMRADFYHRLAECPEFALLAAEQGHLIGPLGRSDLRRAIEEPAHRAGLVLAPGLARRLVEDVEERPGSLPLLQHVLLELWRRRQGRTMTLEAYADSGGIEGALAKRANQVYGSLSPERQEICRHVLLRLTEPGVGSEDTRRRAELRELVREEGEREGLEEVVGALAEARLVTASRDPSGEPALEVAHEALIRGWPRLRAWIDEEREGLRARRRLTEAAREWQAGGREDALLYRGARLGAWAERGEAGLNQAEREFLAAGRGREDRERAGRRRRVRLALGGLAGALVLISGVAGVALWQRQVATGQRDTARSRQIAGVAEAQLPTDPQLALLLALRAYRTSPTQEAELMLRQSTHDSLTRAVLHVGGSFTTAIAFSPDGARLAVATKGAGAQVWDLRDGRRAFTIVQPRGLPVGVAFSPDGRQLLVGRALCCARGKPLPTTGGGAPVTRWDVATGRFLGVLPGASGLVFAALSPGGRLVAMYSESTRAARIIDWRQQRILRRLQLAGSDYPSFAFNAGGGTFAECSSNGILRMWRTDGAGKPLVVRGCGALTRLALSSDGRRVAGMTPNPGLRLRVWRVDSRRHRLRPLARPAGLGTLAGDQEPRFTPDGRLMVGRTDGRVVVWDPKTRTSITLRGHDGLRTRFAVSRDGRLAAADGVNDHTVVVWDLGSRPPQILSGGGGGVFDLDLDAAGRTLATASVYGGLQVRSLVRAAPPVTLLDGRDARGRPRVVTQAAMSLDGRRIESLGHDQLLRIWDVPHRLLLRVLGRVPPGGHRFAAMSADGRLVAAADGVRIRLWRGPNGSPELLPFRKEVVGVPDVHALSFSRDGHRLAVATGSQGLYIWTVARTTTPLILDVSPSEAADFSPDGLLVADAGFDGSVRVWDLASRRVVTTLPGEAGVVWTVRFSPDGRLLVSSGPDGAVRVWDWRRGVTLLVLRGHRGAVEATRFTPDGRHVISAGLDGTVRIWACDVCGSARDVVALAERRTARALTPEERRRFLPG